MRSPSKAFKTSGNSGGHVNTYRVSKGYMFRDMNLDEVPSDVGIKKGLGVPNYMQRRVLEAVQNAVSKIYYS